MTDFLQTYWWVILLVVVVGAALFWWTGRSKGPSNTSAPVARTAVKKPDEVTAAKSPTTSAAPPPAAAKPTKQPIADTARAEKRAATTAPADVVDSGAATGAAQGKSDAKAKATGPRIAAAKGAPDNLLLIKGIGPKLNAICQTVGVLRFDQIAKWTDKDIAEVDAHLVGFHGRIVRDRWVEQATFLASDDRAGYEALFGKV